MRFSPRLLSLLLLCSPVLVQATVYPPCGETGLAVAENRGGEYQLKNKLFSANYEWKDGKLSFDGLFLRNGVAVATGESSLFCIQLQNGTLLSSSSMTAESAPIWVDLAADPKAVRQSEKVPGKALECTFVSSPTGVKVKWRAVLREGSAYLRNEMTISSSRETGVKEIVGMQYKMFPAPGSDQEVVVSGNTRGSVVVSQLAFAGMETPMGINSVKSDSSNSPGWSPESWTADSWAESSMSPSVLAEQWGNDSLRFSSGPVDFSKKGEATLTFDYKSGNTRLNIVGVELLSREGKLISHDYHAGFTGQNSHNNSYTLTIPASGKYILRYWSELKTEPITSSGKVTCSLPLSVASFAGKKESVAQSVEGKWKRNATLQPGETWTTSSVLGILAPHQARRSVLAYVERERAVPYRPFIHYNSWYELNINRNNDADPMKRMLEKQCLDVLAVWKEKMYLKRGVNLDAFVWDDGWDEFNSMWDFHKGFPQGFTTIYEQAKSQKAGIGAWLGPVGGYGSSKAQRLENWNKLHPENKIDNFQLSNKEYYDAFKGRCSQMITDYNMAFFKFDGISTHFHAKGPDEAREQDAEGILKLVSELREQKPDLYVNCTVGTWASPFWYRYVDSIWRQENDWDSIGEGDSREKWITYRDRLVWEVFVQGSPLCPINSIMFHGVLVSQFGPPAQMPKEVAGIKKEIRCSFGGGSSLQELYLDNDLMTTLGSNEELWDELAKGIKWLRANADVMADVHWVGGNPWDQQTKKASIYGWAAWNSQKAVFTLRNPSATEQTIATTLRQVLDLPPNVKGHFTFRNVHDDQRALPGFTNTAVDADAPIKLTLKPFEVFVWEKAGN